MTPVSKIIHIAIMSFALCATAPAWAKDPLEEKLLSFFDLNEEVAYYAKRCLQEPDPSLMTRYRANADIVAQALLNHAADARPNETATAVRSQLRERQAFKRNEGEQLFATRGCHHAASKAYQQHFVSVSAMTAPEMEAAVYGKALTQIP